MKRVMVDMSVTILHPGHIRLLSKARQYGHVIVALTTDKEIHSKKGFWPELDFYQRKEIIESIKFVDEVVPSPWLLDDAFLDQHRVDILVHGNDNTNNVRSERLLIFNRTEGISSSILRERSSAIHSALTFGS
jgi:glycerol-3-phosphate cytidylyltransferase